MLQVLVNSRRRNVTVEGPKASHRARQDGSSQRGNPTDSLIENCSGSVD